MVLIRSPSFAVWYTVVAALGCSARIIPRQNNGTQCRQTKVAILGAGVAGITAAQALSNASVSDFLIIERNDYIGGRGMTKFRCYLLAHGIKKSMCIHLHT